MDALCVVNNKIRFSLESEVSGKNVEIRQYIAVGFISEPQTEEQIRYISKVYILTGSLP